MLNTFVPSELLAVLAQNRDEPVAFPGSLGCFVQQLYGKPSRCQRFQESADPPCIVVPPASVHVGAVLQRQGRARATGGLV